MVGFPSGQRDQTVNLTRKLRWFESTPHHHMDQVALSTPPIAELALSETLASWRLWPGGCSSMVEPQPSKLMMRVRFPSPAPTDRCWF